MDYKYKKLVESAKAGSEEAKLELLKHLKPLMFSAIRRWGRGMDIDDLKQEARLVVLEGIEKYNEDRGIPFLCYIKTMMYYRIHNLGRKHARILARNTPLEEKSYEAAQQIDLLENEETNLEEGILRKERNIALRAALDRLPPRQRYVVDQHILYKRKLTVIAREIGVSYKTVLRDKKKAVEILSDLLEI